MPILSEAPGDAAVSPDHLQRILKIKVPVVVRLARKRLTLSEVMRLGSGAILEFNKRSDDPLELLVNNKAIGMGEAVKVGENFGLRVTSIGDVREKIQALGG
jgi:flagellar motor switch protein FliN/FliY